MAALVNSFSGGSNVQQLSQAVQPPSFGSVPGADNSFVLPMVGSQTPGNHCQNVDLNQMVPVVLTFFPTPAPIYPVMPYQGMPLSAMPDQSVPLSPITDYTFHLLPSPLTGITNVVSPASPQVQMPVFSLHATNHHPLQHAAFPNVPMNNVPTPQYYAPSASVTRVLGKNLSAPFSGDEMSETICDSGDSRRNSVESVRSQEPEGLFELGEELDIQLFTENQKKDLAEKLAESGSKASILVTSEGKVIAFHKSRARKGRLSYNEANNKCLCTITSRNGEKEECVMKVQVLWKNLDIIQMSFFDDRHKESIGFEKGMKLEKHTDRPGLTKETIEQIEDIVGDQFEKGGCIRARDHETCIGFDLNSLDAIYYFPEALKMITQDKSLNIQKIVCVEPKQKKKIRIFMMIDGEYEQSKNQIKNIIEENSIFNECLMKKLNPKNKVWKFVDTARIFHKVHTYLKWHCLLGHDFLNQNQFRDVRDIFSQFGSVVQTVREYEDQMMKASQHVDENEAPVTNAVRERANKAPVTNAVRERANKAIERVISYFQIPI